MYKFCVVDWKYNWAENRRNTSSGVYYVDELLGDNKTPQKYKTPITK